MNSKVEDGEDSDMEDMAYMEEKKWETGDSEELIRVQEISKTFHLSAKQRKWSTVHRRPKQRWIK